MNSLLQDKDCKILFVSWIIGLTAVTLLLVSTVAVQYADASYHDVAIVGDFQGKFDHKSINADGDFRISNNKHMFTLLGDFEKDVDRHDVAAGEGEDALDAGFLECAGG